MHHPLTTVRRFTMASSKSLTEDFEEDIFISYDHDDNASLLTDHQGWVDTMHDSLAKRLTMVIGEKPKIWRDTTNLRGVDDLSETIVIRLARTAFLASILSPSYVKSEWCQKELNEFYKRAAENGGIKIDNKSRIFKIMKTPVGDDDPTADPLEGTDLPLELRRLLQESLGYKFYEFDNAGRAHEFWPELGQEDRKKFLRKLDDLVYDIKAFIKRKPPAAKCVYLAETTPELSEERYEIKRELQLSNYTVLPDESLPFDEGEFEEKVSKHLAQSVLSVHLIGTDSAAAPDGKSASATYDLRQKLAAERVRKQHQLAMKRGKGSPGFSRLIWMPKGLKAQGRSYQEFLSHLQNEPDVYDGGEVLCGIKLEDLKTAIEKALQGRQQEPRTGDATKCIYLYCDKQDLDAVAPLRNYLTERLYKVVLPFKEESKFKSGHRENLRACDAAIIFYGSTDGTVEYKLTELGKSIASRDKPLLASGVYVGGQETEGKKAFQTDDAIVMKNFGEFSPEALTPFLEQLERPVAQGRARGARV
jgi:hypothetical protein